MPYRLLLQQLSEVKRLIINDPRVHGTEAFDYTDSNNQQLTFRPTTGLCALIGLSTTATQILYCLRKHWPGRCTRSLPMFVVPGPNGIDGESAYNSDLHKYKGEYGDNRLAMINWMIDELSFRGDKWELAAILQHSTRHLDYVSPGPSFMLDVYRRYAPASQLSYQAIDLLDFHISDKFVRKGVHVKDNPASGTQFARYRYYIDQLKEQAHQLGKTLAEELAAAS